MINAKHFQASQRDNKTILELEVSGLQRAIERAKDAGGHVITEPEEVTKDGWHAAIETPQGVLLWLWENRAELKQTSEAIHQGPVHFTVDRQVDAPPNRVFEAITKAEHVSSFFVSSADDDLSSKKTVTWSWEGHGNGALHVLEFRPNEYVAFHWKADRLPYHTRTQFNLAPHNAGTRITITENGWDGDTQGLRSAFSHCEGWTQFLDNLKVYLEHDLAMMKV